MKIAKVKKTYLKVPFSSSDTTLTLLELVDHKGNELAMTDFDDYLVAVVRQGNTIEMVLCDGITQNADGSATLDVATSGRELSGTYPYAGTTVGEDFSSSAEVIIGDDPYTMYQITIAYANALAIAGAPDMSTTVKGIGEKATYTEIDADTANGATGAPFVLTPDQMVLSKYYTRLPSAVQKTFLNGIIGMVSPYAGITAPTGFNLCDGSTLTLASYPLLGAIVLGRYGYGTAVTFTADAGTDFITSVSHGLSDGDAILVDTTVADLPAGLSINTLYYVRDKTTNTFKVALTAGGSAIDITDAGTGTHSFYTSFKVPNLKGRIPVGYTASAPTFIATFVSRSSNTITVSGADNHANNELQTGQKVLYSAPSGAMAGLTHNTEYYLIRVAYNQFSLATSVENANYGIAISLSSDGTGTQTFTITYTARPLGQEGGAETMTQVPAHFHTADQIGGGTADARDSGALNIVEVSGTTGGATPNNMPPFVVLNYIIKTD